MKTIYKYLLDPVLQQTVVLPEGSEILTVAAQDDTICIWAKVDSDVPGTQQHRIQTVGTGREIQDAANSRYIGTAFLNNGLVYHFFEMQQQ